MAPKPVTFKKMKGDTFTLDLDENSKAGYSMLHAFGPPLAPLLLLCMGLATTGSLVYVQRLPALQCADSPVCCIYFADW